MIIRAKVENREGEHEVALQTEGREHSLTIAPRVDGFGSSANGGELLFLALATCYCNDIYREAKKRGIAVERVRVEVSGEFGGEGDGGRNIRYSAAVDARASRDQILELMRHTDSVAEIQNTLRSGAGVLFVGCEVRDTRN